MSKIGFTYFSLFVTFFEQQQKLFFSLLNIKTCSFSVSGRQIACSVLKQTMSTIFGKYLWSSDQDWTNLWGELASSSLNNCSIFWLHWRGEGKSEIIPQASLTNQLQTGPWSPWWRQMVAKIRKCDEECPG